MATILWHYFHYKLFAILAYGDLYLSLDVHELGKTLINKLIGYWGVGVEVSKWLNR
jgi:hypothetical protein